MFQRTILDDFESWANKNHRKPLILRGARQVGKTTAVRMFAERFPEFIDLNLEIHSERNLFEKNYSIEELLQAIHFIKNKKRLTGKKTLIFIDEIQNSPAAIAALRYFYESASEYFVIVAGSLLETILDTNVNFPVGRVEYLFMKPITFLEYLRALDPRSYEFIQGAPQARDHVHAQLMKHFFQYTLIGGMPEVVKEYQATLDLVRLKSIYDSLLLSYLDDVEKYANNDPQVRVIRHVIETSFSAAGERIRFEGFGQSRYRSREISEAFKVLEKSMVLHLMYPSVNLKPPMLADYKKSPRLHLLDTGLVNYFSGLQKELFTSQNLDEFYKGKIAEHIVGQELLAQFQSLNEKIHFWVREKKQSQAQVDYLIPFKDLLLPIEVKIGKAGRLRSLHEFIDQCPHHYGIRIYSGPYGIDQVNTLKGKPYQLINLPFYLIGKIKEILETIIN